MGDIEKIRCALGLRPRTSTPDFQWMSSLHRAPFAALRLRWGFAPLPTRRGNFATRGARIRSDLIRGDIPLERHIRLYRNKMLCRNLEVLL